MLIGRKEGHVYFVKCPYCAAKIVIDPFSEELHSIQKRTCTHVKIISCDVESVDGTLIFFRPPFRWSRRTTISRMNKAQQSIIPTGCKVRAGDK